MNRVTGRVFNVDYYEKEEEVWVAETTLKDDVHEITVRVEIDMTTFTITDGQIDFIRYPLDNCPQIENLANKLQGVKIDESFSRFMRETFLGPQGCSNIMTMLSVSIPGILYYYYPHKVAQGKMSQEQWNGIITGKLKNACLAHAML